MRIENMRKSKYEQMKLYITIMNLWTFVSHPQIDTYRYCLLINQNCLLINHNNIYEEYYSCELFFVLPAELEMCIFKKDV